MGHFSSDRWSLVTTIASGIVSLTILLLFTLKFLTGEAFSFLDSLDVGYVAAGLAGAHVLFSLIIAPFALKKHQTIAGLISLALFSSLCGLVIYFTPEHAGTLFFLWLACISLSGLYHWLLPIILGGLGITYVFLDESLGSEFTTEKFLIVCISALTTVISIVIWEVVKSNKKKQNKAFAASALQTLELETLIDSIADGVVIVNGNGQIELINPSAVSISGWGENEAISLDHKSVFKLQDDKERDLSEDEHPITKALKTQEAIVDNSGFLVAKSGNKKDIDLIASPLLSASKKLMGAVIIFRDVSKARGEERQRAEFISTASHEMRTPVASIEGYLGLALNEKVSKIDDAARNYLVKAHKSTQHLGRLFQDLLTAAKTEDGRLTNHPTILDIGELLDEMSHDMEFTAKENGLELKANFGSGDVSINNQSKIPTIRPVAYVNVDPERIREVITNLFDNAVKYTEEGSITIGMGLGEGTVSVSIEDTGIGISKEDLPHLFQKFYRVDNSDTRQIGGTGLGLFICRKILDLYKGNISAESEKGKGTKFTFTLPRIPASEASKMKQIQANTITPSSNEDSKLNKPMPELPKEEPAPKKEPETKTPEPKPADEPAKVQAPPQKPVTQDIKPAAKPQPKPPKPPKPIKINVRDTHSRPPQAKIYKPKE